MLITDKWFYIALLIIAPAIVVISVNEIIEFFFKNASVSESSVWCLKGSRETNMCKFKNICYDSEFKSLLFFLNEKTIIKGIGHYKDLQKIQLSSVHSHNQFYANVSVIDVDKYEEKKQILQYQKAFLFSRFKPNNLMHIIHDDLFPLFLSLESACLGDTGCMGEYNLIMFDRYPKGPYFELYQLFSNRPPIVMGELMLKTNLVCFKQMLTGLSQDGIFFDYGFNKPQGPVKANLLNQNDIYRFTEFIKSKMKIGKNNSNLVEVVLINRMKSRKILNIKEIGEMIKSAYQKLSKKIILKIINLESSANVIDLIKVISKADVLIGMHGAEMILSLFMKPKSILFELFPFGIQPDAVSFIKPLTKLENSELAYFPWRNMYRNHSVAHPDAHPLFGGIIHLDKADQEKIKSISEVPPVKCCNDPLYLHHMYQDTFVPDEFEDFFYSSVSGFYAKQDQTRFGKMMKKWFFPYKVGSVSCRFHPQLGRLNITWQPPFNVDSDDLDYRLYVKGEIGPFEGEFSARGSGVQLEVPVGVVQKFQVWISTRYDANNSEGPDLYVECA